MIRTAAISILLIASAVQTACRTAPIPDFAPLTVPSGLSIQQIELAIFSGILNRPPPPEFDPSEALSDEEFQALLWKHYLSEARGRSWFPESHEPGVIRASVTTRGHYLRVALSYDRVSIRTRIEESRELLQSDTRIHGRAIKWINRLHEHIRRELKRMAFSNPSAA
jgi:hypothetical protein